MSVSFALMESTLRTKSDHTIEEEFFHDMLDEHFTEAEVRAPA